MKSNRAIRKAIMMVTTLNMVAILPLTAYASSNYAENAGKWVLDQAFWVILVVGIIGFATAIIKRAYTAGVIAGVATGVVCYFCKNPEKLSAIGEQLAQTFGF